MTDENKITTMSEETYTVQHLGSLGWYAFFDPKPTIELAASLFERTVERADRKSRFRLINSRGEVLREHNPTTKEPE